MSPGRKSREWLHRSVFLSGWWLVGLVSAIRLGGSRRGSPEAHFARWLVTWTIVAAAIRIGLLVAKIEDAGVIRLWETFGLFPATLLAARVGGRVLRREASWQLVLTRLMVTIGHLLWMITGTLSIGLIVGAAFGIWYWPAHPSHWGFAAQLWRGARPKSAAGWP